MIETANISLFPPILGKKMQLGLVVPDLNASLLYWTERLKVGPFVVIERPGGAEWSFVHRGEVSPIQISIAFAYIGDVQIELSQPLNDAPSLYREFLKDGREGVHHLAFWPEQFPQACEELCRAGFSEVTTIKLADGTKAAAFFETPRHVGLLVEVAPLTDARKKYYAGIKKLSENWDGSRPIRRFTSYADYMASDDCK